MILSLYTLIHRGDDLGGKPQFPFNVFKRFGYSDRSLVAAYAGICKGKDMAATQNEFGCMEAVNTVIEHATGTPVSDTWGVYVSTYKSFQHMLRDSRYEFIQGEQNLKKGDIIISPSGYGTGGLSNGHVGIYAGNGRIWSNNSYTFKWDSHWTLEAWKDHYMGRGGFPVHFVRLRG